MGKQERAGLGREEDVGRVNAKGKGIYLCCGIYTPLFLLDRSKPGVRQLKQEKRELFASFPYFEVVWVFLPSFLK